MFQLFGEIGLFSYIVLAVIISNIEVLKTVDVSFLGFPIALGTIVFSSSFIAVDILTELYGPERAKKSVWLGFAATLFALLAMFLAIAMKPTIDSAGIDNALRLIFVPMPSIFFASLISYLTSQYIDIWIFQAVKNITSGKYLWARTILASSTAAFVDNVIFSLFAWVIFAANPASLHKLIHTYIIGTYIFRIVVIITQVPIMYFVRAMFKVRPKNAL
ncbi:MAG: queuosine precursor transporter [Rickettsiaceae bacterium]|nr:queuosine precursor transporter [Rickettsiaceae bacterium]